MAGIVRTLLCSRQGQAGSVGQSAAVYLHAVTSTASACEVRARSCVDAFTAANKHANLSLPHIVFRRVILCSRGGSLRAQSSGSWQPLYLAK